jgi:pyrimidine operon attenuation protein/uracil phosphoribosyltransferase
MRVLADAQNVAALEARMAEHIRGVMASSGDAAWAVVGIRRRGDVLAQRIAPRLDAARLDGRAGSLDITLYRDDLSEIGAQPVVRTTHIPFAIDGLQLVLIDDVLMSGRSVRAALQSLMDLGRPARVWLAVLVDRGGRELPIEPNFAALTPRELGELSERARVEVRLKPIDADDAILLQEPAT